MESDFRRVPGQFHRSQYTPVQIRANMIMEPLFGLPLLSVADMVVEVILL